MGHRGRMSNSGWAKVQLQISKDFLEVTLQLTPKRMSWNWPNTQGSEMGEAFQRWL